MKGDAKIAAGGFANQLKARLKREEERRAAQDAKPSDGPRRPDMNYSQEERIEAMKRAVLESRTTTATATPGQSFNLDATTMWATGQVTMGGVPVVAASPSASCHRSHSSSMPPSAGSSTVVPIGSGCSVSVSAQPRPLVVRGIGVYAAAPSSPTVRPGVPVIHAASGRWAGPVSVSLFPQHSETSDDQGPPATSSYAPGPPTPAASVSTSSGAYARSPSPLRGLPSSIRTRPAEASLGAVVCQSGSLSAPSAISTTACGGNSVSLSSGAGVASRSYPMAYSITAGVPDGGSTSSGAGQLRALPSTGPPLRQVSAVVSSGTRTPSPIRVYRGRPPSTPTATSFVLGSGSAADSNAAACSGDVLPRRPPLMRPAQAARDHQRDLQRGSSNKNGHTPDQQTDSTFQMKREVSTDFVLDAAAMVAKQQQEQRLPVPLPRHPGRFEALSVDDSVRFAPADAPPVSARSGDVSESTTRAPSKSVAATALEQTPSVLSFGVALPDEFESKRAALGKTGGLLLGRAAEARASLMEEVEKTRAIIKRLQQQAESESNGRWIAVPNGVTAPAHAARSGDNGTGHQGDAPTLKATDDVMSTLKSEVDRVHQELVLERERFETWQSAMTQKLSAAASPQFGAGRPLMAACNGTPDVLTTGVREVGEVSETSTSVEECMKHRMPSFGSSTMPVHVEGGDGVTTQYSGHTNGLRESCDAARVQRLTTQEIRAEMAAPEDPSMPPPCESEPALASGPPRRLPFADSDVGVGTLVGSFDTKACGSNIMVSADGYVARRVRGVRGAVVLGTMPLERQVCGSLYFEVEITETARGMAGGLAIGVTHTVPKQLSQLPETADGLPSSFIVGYEGQAYLGGSERRIGWQPEGLLDRQRVGCLVTGDENPSMVLLVDDVQVLSVDGETLQSAGFSQGQPLYPVVDVFSSTVAVRLVPRAVAPPMDRWAKLQEADDECVNSSPDRAVPEKSKRSLANGWASGLAAERQVADAAVGRFATHVGANTAPSGSTPRPSWL